MALIRVIIAFLKLLCQNTKLGAIFTLVSAGKCSGEFPFTAGLYPLSVKEILQECLLVVDQKEPTNAFIM
jgi:hypothetical protein